MLLAGEGNHSQQGNGNEHDPSQRTRHAHLVGLEGVVVDQQGDKRRSIARAALGDDVGAVEFLERLCDLGNEVVEDNGGDHRNGDREELAGLGSTIDGGGLVQVSRHTLQGSQEQNHGRTELPHTQQADDEQRPGLVSQPVGTGNAEEAEDRVDDAGILEQGTPQNGNGHRTAQDGRDVVDGTEQVDELDLEVQNVGNEQRKDQFEGHRDESILHGGQQDGDRLAAGKDLDVVHKAVLADALEEVQVSKAVHQRAGERISLENQETKNPGNQEEKTGVFVAPALERGALNRFGGCRAHPKTSYRQIAVMRFNINSRPRHA